MMLGLIHWKVGVDVLSTVYCYDKKQVYFHSPAGIVPLKCWYL